MEHLLQRYTGCSFKAHLRHARMAAAASLLSDTFLTIKEIATCVGCSSVACLDRQFRRQFGTTPTAWRHAQLR
jgi:transcriptional regulator GlxA family with amidase domain